MRSNASTPDEYVAGLPPERRELVSTLRRTINDNVPGRVAEGMQYGMLGWHVPHSVYPDGYHTDPEQPVPYIGLASQKAKVSLYMFCMYVDAELTEWFAAEYRSRVGKEPDMGKSCVRFKKASDVPVDLLAETIRKMPLDAFLERYAAQIPDSAKKRS